LQQTCIALEDSLAEIYLQLAESWLRRNQPQKATAVWKKILQLCPDRHQAQLAQSRLQQIGKEFV
jgi:TolA-binding protein